MNGGKLFTIGIFAFALFITLYSWKEIIEYGDLKRQTKAKEGFMDLTDDKIINSIIKTNEPVPTDAEAIAAHQTLLRYIRNDITKGIKIVNDFGNRFFGDNLPLRPDLDIRTLMDNYRNPL